MYHILFCCSDVDGFVRASGLSYAFWGKILWDAGKRSAAERKKNKWCDIAEVKRIRIHDFRHSCASLLINNGANITIVSKYLGHSDISMTLNRYSHMYDSKLEEVINLIENINK